MAAPGPRLFVAAWPPAAVGDTLAGIPRDPEPGVTWEPPDLAHVTLRFLGPCDPHTAAAALATLASPVATARFGPAVVMLGPSVVCVPVAGLDPLAADVVACTSDIGQPPDDRRFVGHLTIARVRRNASCTAVGHRVSGSFTVGSVALVRSDPPTASRPVRCYTTLATFDLTTRLAPGP
jgi:RNA 2',3'-cyclic 3'-phosphodiesterase